MNRRMLDEMEPGFRTVALGNFDGVHLGHREVIRALEGHGMEKAVLCFAEDPTVFLGRPEKQITGNAVKEYIFESLGVDTVIYMDFNSSLRNMNAEEFIETMLRRTGARFVACGENYRFGYQSRGNTDLLREELAKHQVGCDVVGMFSLNGEIVSATKIRKYLEEGDVEKANRMLGHPYAIWRRVTEGNRLGREIGVPTINQDFSERDVIPRFGVYATRVLFEGESYAAVTNVGCKPTVGKHRPLFETHISGFQRDVYGEEIYVEFLAYLRPEMKFSSLEELKRQITKDISSAKQLTEKYFPVRI